MSIKLHSKHITPYSWRKPCGPSVVSLLTGKSVEAVIEEMLNYRRSKPRYTTEYTYGRDRQYYADGSTMYLREMLHFIRPFTTRRKPLYAPPGLTIERLAEAAKQPLVLATSMHFCVLENGLLSDNQWFRNPVSGLRYRKTRVYYTIPLDRAA